jgi:hypothetical protein
MLSFECIDLEGLMGEVFLEPISDPLFSFDSRLLPAGRNSRDDLLALEEMVAAAAAGGLGKVRREGGKIPPSARRAGGSKGLWTLTRVSRVDMGCSK